MGTAAGRKQFFPVHLSPIREGEILSIVPDGKLGFGL
jgi:hypothetical protein